MGIGWQNAAVGCVLQAAKSHGSLAVEKCFRSVDGGPGAGRATGMKLQTGVGADREPPNKMCRESIQPWEGRRGGPRQSGRRAGALYLWS